MCKTCTAKLVWLNNNQHYYFCHFFNCLQIEIQTIDRAWRCVVSVQENSLIFVLLRIALAPSLKRIIKMLHSVVYRDSQSILYNLHRQHLTSKKTMIVISFPQYFMNIIMKRFFSNICAYTLLCSGLLSLAVI